MGNLIKFEFHKVFRSKYLYIIFGIGLVFAFVNALMMWGLNAIMEEVGEPTTPYSGYLNAKSALAGTASFSTFAGIFVGIFATEDFTQHTIKNIIGRGYSRLQLYFSKYIVSLVLVIALAILQVLASLALGFALFGDGGLPIDDNVFLIFLCQLLCVITFHSVFFAISFSVAKVGLAIVINILAFSLITTIVALIDTFANIPDVQFTYYLVDGILANLCQPYTNMDVVPLGIGLLFAYIAVSQTAGILLARKKQF